MYESTNNKLPWDFKIQTTRLNTTSLTLWYWIRQAIQKKLCLMRIVTIIIMSGGANEVTCSLDR